MAEKMTIEHLYQPQEKLVSIKLIKGQKDTYGWEIKAEAKTVDEAVKQTQYADAILKKIYLTDTTKEEVKTDG